MEENVFDWKEINKIVMREVDDIHDVNDVSENVLVYEIYSTLADRRIGVFVRRMSNGIFHVFDDRASIDELKRVNLSIDESNFISDLAELYSIHEDVGEEVFYIRVDKISNLSNAIREMARFIVTVEAFCEFRKTK